MVDLIEKFFQEDLTDAERTALGQELSVSEEAARRFGARAEEAYRAFGLPEPQWTGPDALRIARKSGRLKWLWFGLILVGIMGFPAWRYLSQNKLESEAPVPILALPEAEPSAPIQHKPKHPKQVPVATGVLTVAKAVTIPHPETKAIAPTRVPVSLPKSIPTLVVQSPHLARPQFTPVNVDQDPNRPFSSLSVVLHRSTAGFLTVRILDGYGVELLPLYSGNLPAGAWAFEWNGLLRDGRVAPRGIYKIEVRAGSWVQTKEVIIQ